MSKLTMNSTKINNIGEELKAISKDYKTILDDMYAKLDNVQRDEIFVSDKSKGSAFQFIAMVLKTKISSYEMVNSINNLGEILSSYGSEVAALADKKVNDE